MLFGILSLHFTPALIRIVIKLEQALILAKMYCILPKGIKKKKKAAKKMHLCGWSLVKLAKKKKKVLFSSYVSIFSHVCITFAFGKDLSYFRGRWF